jgi:hypothetical protein
MNCSTFSHSFLPFFENYRKENGLPCCDPNAEEDPEAEEVRLIGSDYTLMERLNGTSTGPEPQPEPEPEGGE